MPIDQTMNATDVSDPMPFPAGSPLEIAVRSLRSPTGHGRQENQDNYLVIDGQGQARFLWDERETELRLPDWPPGHRRLALLDGMGGHSHGREATEKTLEGLLGLPAAVDLAPISAGLSALHHRLRQQFQAAGLEAGCTLILLEIPPSGPALLFHVGDSRLYVVDARRVRCLTVDHVPATHMALLGLMNGAQWFQRVHAQTNSQISQAFGLGGALGASWLYPAAIAEDLFELHEGNLPLFLRGLGDRRALALEPGRIYLLASDGLWRLANPQAFIQRWPALLGQADRPLEELADSLLAELAEEIRRQRSHPDDNCTVILARRPGRVEHSLPEDIS
ncbi:MAG: SpoIIE family protein phosphatase [Candidatus Contendobacter sp.]|nr:SpoIIE family protein phosphatase [Candidatus Contendobacter sp.]MDG4556130.1 SpoIIE family protein phosphatase [Candidatus Contendobacter sp.]